jgi:hypothetical protein
MAQSHAGMRAEDDGQYKLEKCWEKTNNAADKMDSFVTA